MHKILLFAHYHQLANRIQSYNVVRSGIGNTQAPTLTYGIAMHPPVAAQLSTGDIDNNSGTIFRRL